MELLLWIESNSFVEWTRTTGWVYPWVISFHSIGMGFLVGVIFMIDLRVLGLGSFPVARLERFLLVIRIAFFVSLASGIVLFAIDAQHFFFSPSFRIKILLVVLGVATSWILIRMAFREDVAWTVDEGSIAPAAAKMVAGLSFLCWAGAILAGRLTAYLP